MSNRLGGNRATSHQSTDRTHYQSDYSRYLTVLSEEHRYHKTIEPIQQGFLQKAHCLFRWANFAGNSLGDWF
jgi:hypothetical protein